MGWQQKCKSDKKFSSSRRVTRRQVVRHLQAMTPTNVQTVHQTSLLHTTVSRQVKRCLVIPVYYQKSKHVLLYLYCWREHNGAQQEHTLYFSCAILVPSVIPDWVVAVFILTASGWNKEHTLNQMYQVVVCSRSTVVVRICEGGVQL